MDCREVVDILNGVALLQAPRLELVFRRIAASLERIAHAGWHPHRDIDDFVRWAPSSYNTVADHMVNAAMTSCQPGSPGT